MPPVAEQNIQKRRWEQQWGKRGPCSLQSMAGIRRRCTVCIMFEEAALTIISQVSSNHWQNVLAAQWLLITTGVLDHSKVWWVAGWVCGGRPILPPPPLRTVRQVRAAYLICSCTASQPPAACTLSQTLKATQHNNRPVLGTLTDVTQTHPTYENDNNKRSSEQAALPPLTADPLTAAAHNRSTVFARWRQCARPPKYTISWTHATHRPKWVNHFPEFMVVTNRQT